MPAADNIRFARVGDDEWQASWNWNGRTIVSEPTENRLRAGFNVLEKTEQIKEGEES